MEDSRNVRGEICRGRRWKTQKVLGVKCVDVEDGMSHVGVGKKCGMVEEVKQQTLK